MTRFWRNLLFSVPVGITFVDVVGSIVKVQGASMQPTLNPEGSSVCDWVFVEKFTVKVLGQFTKGDVVLFWAPDEPNQLVIKRMIALAGDTVIEGDSVQTIPPGRCWVEGDNKSKSGDSRSQYGPVHLGLFEGRVTHIVWPPWRIGKLGHVTGRMEKVLDVDAGV